MANVVFVVRCDRPEWGIAPPVPAESRYWGPFSTESAAKSHVYAEDALRLCDGNHTIIEVTEPLRERELTDWQISSIIDTARGDIVRDIARKSTPFVANGEPSNFNIPQSVGYKIATIKELRKRYPGLTIKESKDIVDQWERDGKVSFHSN
jgi:ribosomal protein L7/L12